ncbi:MAG: nucleotidyltransferase family protein, partial [Actinomycetota bacterium]|nr:nucleotidyltransferase family protein [Actinomycetota bacterium]
MPLEQPTFDELLHAMKRAAAILRDAEISYALSGGLAAYARGGPQTEHDVDFFLKPSDAEGALAALEEAGYRPERPPEEWLFKAYDPEVGVLVDLIFDPSGGPVTDEWLARAEELE